MHQRILRPVHLFLQLLPALLADIQRKNCTDQPLFDRESFVGCGLLRRTQNLSVIPLDQGIQNILF